MSTTGPVRKATIDTLASAASRKSKNRKRLIVLCDGTWQDSTADNASDYPSNVTRFSRALKSSTWVNLKDNSSDSEEVEQIVFYQKGVGTGALDRMVGGAAGLGVSANVRAAYAFLSHNYDVNDEIFFFGFSRGAYTARAIAGLVTTHGLLTKKGMDCFPTLYNYYYRKQPKTVASKADEDRLKEEEDRFVKRLVKDGLLVQEAADAVEVVGVWDTVAFHQSWFGSGPLGKLLGMGKERIEFKNAMLSNRVKYGYHALALDERRKPFLPTLWHRPTEAPEVSARSDGSTTKEMEQVWFSGNHTDIGGGHANPRLSDIPLAWMIAQCQRDDKLAFDDGYLIDKKKARATEATPWDTCQGPTGTDASWFGESLVDKLSRSLPVLSTDRQPMQDSDTNESIHCSIADRAFGAWRGSANAVKFPSKNLSGERHEDGGWKLLSEGAKRLRMAEMHHAEQRYKGRIRYACNHLEKEEQ